MPQFAPQVHSQPARPKADSTAVIALCLALSSFFAWIIPAVVALCLAPQAKRNIAASNGLRGGAGLASAAQIVSAISLVLTFLIAALVVSLA